MSGRKSRQLAEQDVIRTFRILLATCIQHYGTLGTLVLTARQLEAASEGTLSVADRPDGSIVLKIKGGKKQLLPN